MVDLENSALWRIAVSYFLYWLVEMSIDSFSPYPTDDGSYTFFSEQFGQTFHSKFGAKEESIYKFAVPTLLANKAHLGHLRLLDVCYGLGYNTAAALSTIWQANHACTVEIIALEIDETVPIAAIEHHLLAEWEDPIPQLLDELARTKVINTDRLTAKLFLGDARQTIDRVKALEFTADAIFLDPFSPLSCPQLWTIEFIDRVASCCAPDGRIATYSCAAAVRAAMMAAGLHIADSIPVGRKAPGTIASFSSQGLPALTQQELEHLQTRAAIPYRDPTLADSMAKIVLRRELEQDNCNLETTSQWKKRWRNKVE
jgi:tRNA U34 5-methylaminomethyl-2-thiouridine-forming methyltransferase MnmC